MRFSRSFFRTLVSSFFLFSPMLHAETDDFKKLWFDGTIEQAFSKAKTENKPILLYWGAVWCPPCNLLKSQIFNKPEFRAITEPVIRVYLDGDTEAAQKWGESLHASGYPTLLLLSSEGKELFRISNSVIWSEFKETLQTALEAQGSFADALQAAQKKEDVPPSVWKLLAYTHWFAEDVSAEERKNMVELRKKLIAKIPTQFEAEKALLVAGYLEETLNSQEASSKPLVLAKEELAYAKFLLSSQNTIFASREFLVFSAESYLKTMKSSLDAKEFADFSLTYIRATEFIRTRTLSSPELRLWSHYPHLLISREFSTKKKATDPAIKLAIVEAVKRADQEAKTSYERHSVISGAADLLSKVGEVGPSRQLLLKELKQTDTPWYYQSSLASLEEKRGNFKKALEWSRLAKESAKGRATRLQWITNNLLMIFRLAPKNTVAVNKALKEYYDLAFSLPDGFKGRNAGRAKRIAEALYKFENKKGLRSTLNFYKQRCSTSSPELVETCKKLFAFNGK